jgi:hypothetical protein
MGEGLMIGNVLIGACNVMPPLTTNRLLARLTFGYYLIAHNMCMFDNNAGVFGVGAGNQTISFDP